MGRRVLFISHDASRTGATIMLLRTLRWLRTNSSLSFDILLRNGGDLRDEFAQVADVFDANETSVATPLQHARRCVGSLWGGAGAEPDALLGRLMQRNIGLVYSNTITNGQLLRRLAPLGCPVVSHVHELEHWIRFETPREVVEATKEHSDHFIAVSAAVKENLVRNLHVPAQQIDLVHEFIPVAEIVRCPADEAKRSICRQLNLPAASRLVGASGTTDWRKAPDLFIQVARAVRSRGFAEPVHFLWIGGEASGPVWGKLMHDALRAGVADCVHFLGTQTNPFPLYAGLDLFLLTSREDPFPLVMLENAAAGKPTVCFAESGGAPEFVGSDCGLVVPYLDTDAMAEAVLQLLGDAELQQQLGRQAAEKARTFHDMDVGATKILEIIERFLPSPVIKGDFSARDVASPSLAAGQSPVANSNARRLVALYLPQYHPIPENDQWWGKGFTEWTNVTKARPVFPGHYQPHLPADLGYYDLRLPEVRQAQADLARSYGIGAFCYYHYWFGGRRLLERPFQEVLDSGSPDFPFCLCWANENWSRNWDGGHRELLVAQDYSVADDRRHIQWLLQAFADPRYLRVDDRPLMLIYRAKHLPNVRQTTDIWREAAARHGFKGLYLCRVESFSEERDDPTQYGFDAALEFQPDKLQLGKPVNRSSIWKRWLPGSRPSVPGSEGPMVQDYAAVVRRVLAKPAPAYPRFPCVMPSWDNTSRCGRNGCVLRNSTPELYEHWLTEVLRRPPTAAANLVFLNAWNEWAEGNHLEPDMRFGHGYLEATRRALQITASAGAVPPCARRDAA
jgi:glycosyltransferase involved in cell wall biosynthesis